MTGRIWSYPPDFRDALLPFGLAPRAATPPMLVRDALDELYKFELRRLRDRLRAGAVEKTAYLDLVIGLRRKYWMLTLPARAWEQICTG